MLLFGSSNDKKSDGFPWGKRNISSLQIRQFFGGFMLNEAKQGDEQLADPVKSDDPPWII